MFNQIEPLLRRITALEKKVQQLEDDQIKQNRDYKDMMYNLDTDNIPTLDAVVKKVNLVVSEDGNVTAKFIMEVVNNKSNVEITADRISLIGNDEVILGDKIKATSDGKMTVESAEIKRDCVLGSDIEQGKGMQLGQRIADETCASNAAMYLTKGFDSASQGYTRGIDITSTLLRKKGVSNPTDTQAIQGGVEIDAKRAGAHMRATTKESPVALEKGFVGLSRDDTNTASRDRITAIMRVGDHAIWIDSDGNLKTTAQSLVTGQQPL